MGAWSESIYGNDTAQDLKQEYQAVFLRNDVETALKKLDAYVRAVGMIDSDFGMNNEYGSPDMEILEAILTGTKLR